MIYLIAAFYGAVVWRIRGGAFTAATGVDLGADGGRSFCGAAFAAPLAYLAHDWRLLALAPAFFIGLALIGWGPYMDMNADHGNEKPSPWSWIPGRIGIPADSLAHDLIGMASAGTLCVAFPAGVLWWLHLQWWCVLGVGPLFAPLYLLADRLPLPTCVVVDDGPAWGEVFVGALLGVALVVGALHG